MGISFLSTWFLFAAVFLLGGCATRHAILFGGMGDHHRVVTSSESLSQSYFDQGLTLCYAFNFGEAARSFAEAARIDPDCAMSWWGQAFALGPNYNSPFDEEKHELAYVAIQRAFTMRDKASPVERDLIEALALRLESPPPKNRAHLDKAYAEAMERVWLRHPLDEDVGVLYADARMNQNRWNLWTKDGTPNTHTLTIIATLEQVMKINVNHPGANHMYIHAVEPSPNPGRAEVVADRLLHLVPGDGHLVHMPSHIYVQVDRYMDAIKCNVEARQRYREYFASGGQDTDIHFSQAHDTHFLIWAAMFQGRWEDAVNGCDDLMGDLPESLHGDPSADEFHATKLHVLIRFGRWDEI